MRIRFFFVSSLLVCAALSSTACGPEGPRTFDSGLPGDRALGDLSPAEMAQLCEAANDYVEEAARDAELRHSGCIFQALRAETIEACHVALTACVAEPAPLSALDCSTVMPAPECDALVADQEACMTDTLNQLRTAGEGLDCSLVGTADLSEVLAERTATSWRSPASCASIIEDPGCRTPMME